MTKLKANYKRIFYWSARTKCWMCKHRFDEPVILPVKSPQPGVLQPNYNLEILFHLQDTHGIPHEAVPRMVFNDIYGIEQTLQSVYGEQPEERRNYG